MVVDEVTGLQLQQRKIVVVHRHLFVFDEDILRKLSARTIILSHGEGLANTARRASLDGDVLSHLVPVELGDVQKILLCHKFTAN